MKELKKEELVEYNGGFILEMAAAFSAGFMLYLAVSTIENPEEAWEGFKDVFN
jgi:hypothetical protein